MSPAPLSSLDYVVGVADEPLMNRDAYDGLVLMQAGLGKFLAANIDTQHGPAAQQLIDEVEAIGRQADAMKIKAFDSIDRSGVYALDGHRSAKPMIAHAGRLSGPEAASRQKTTKALRALPQVAVAFHGGRISTSMVNKLGRVYANPRVRDLMAEADGWFLSHCLNDTYEFFDLVISEWENLADEDGAERRDARHTRSRDHQMYQDEEGQWHWKGSVAAYDGALTKDVFDAFERIEFDIDWQWAQDNHGPDANPTHMPRTAAQRRADAFAKVHEYAAKALKAETGQTITTDMVIDDTTFERETKKLFGEDVAPDDPQREDRACHTLSGHSLPAKTAVSHALLGELRRVVIGTDGVVIDLGRRRLFTGYARLAAQLNAHECYWPGCHVNVKNCQIDHLTPYSEAQDRGGGLTNPHNAGVACGKHNRHKERGYTVQRKPDGTIEIRRPDDSILD